MSLPMHWCPAPRLRLKPQTGWAPCEITRHLTQVLTPCLGSVLVRIPSWTIQVLTGHARPLPSGLPSETCTSSGTSGTSTFLWGLSPHPAWALMLIGLPSSYSTGSDTFPTHGCLPCPVWALTLWLADQGLLPSPTNHAQHHLIALGLKCLRRKEQWKGRENGKNLLLYVKCERKAYYRYHSQKLKEEAAVLLTFPTFKLIPRSCLIIKSIISTKIPLSALEYNFLKCYMCVLEK